MPANGRWDLIRRLKDKLQSSSILFELRRWPETSYCSMTNNRISYDVWYLFRLVPCVVKYN